MGAGRRQHHAQQDAMRRANEEANRQKAMMEQQQRAMEAQLKAQREAVMAQTKVMTEGGKNPGMLPFNILFCDLGFPWAKYS